MERGCVLVFWGLAVCSLTGTVLGAESDVVDDGHARNKRGGMVMFGKRADDDSDLAMGSAGQDVKRPFGWNTYQWDHPAKAFPGDIDLENGNAKRKFLFGKRNYQDDGADVQPEQEKRARTFSFGKRMNFDADPVPYDDSGALVDDDSVDKRRQMFMFGKRPFGMGSHQWGDGSSYRADKGAGQNKRLFKFGKRAIDA